MYPCELLPDNDAARFASIRSGETQQMQVRPWIVRAPFDIGESWSLQGRWTLCDGELRRSFVSAVE